MASLNTHSTHNLRIGDMTQSITLTVSGLAGFEMRLAIARQVFRLGAWIAGVNIIVTDDPPQPAPR